MFFSLTREASSILYTEGKHQNISYQATLQLTKLIIKRVWPGSFINELSVFNVGLMIYIDKIAYTPQYPVKCAVFYHK